VKIYVIQEIGWQYNDEYWYREDGDTGRPHQACFSKATAEKKCDELNIQFLMEIGDNVFGYGNEEGPDLVTGVTERDFAAWINAAGGKADHEAQFYEWLLPRPMSEAIARRLLDFVTVRGYEVVELDVD
jgi:hypothetical protein